MDVKTAISIPDPIYEAAEELAQRLGLSRSALYARAVAAFVEASLHDDVTARLDAVHDDETAGLDATLAAMQWASLPREDW